MEPIFSDQEITALIKERKVLPNNQRNKFRKRMNRGSNEYLLNITGEEDGTNFELLSE